jgi:hypothetical protein
VQVPGPPAFDVFFWQKTRPGYQVFGSTEKLTVEVGDIVKKVADQAPDRFFWLDIFLTAYVTVSSVQFRITIQADFLMTLFTM